MAIIRYKASEVPAPSQADFEAFDKISDDEIDCTDIPEIEKNLANNAVRGWENRHLLINQLDNDVALWLSQQDKETKVHINNIIREMMAIRQHTDTLSVQQQPFNLNNI